MLFEDRLGIDVYRPIGMEWFTEGYWAINDLEDTAKQFLDLDAAKPKDGTPPLNRYTSKIQQKEGEYFVLDPGGYKAHRAATLDFFKANDFDYVLASIPAHVPLFKELIAKYKPNAKLIVQVGNNWRLEDYQGLNVLASIAPRVTWGVNVMFYHQEFDTKIFKRKPVKLTHKIHTYVNVLGNMPTAEHDFLYLERLLPDYEFKSYGGQCRDGNMNGPVELAKSMHEAEFILHSKPGGDGFGHIIFNAYACGRPVIARPSQYRAQLAEQLLVPGTFLDLDALGLRNCAEKIQLDERFNPDEIKQMGLRAAARFKEVVDYDKEGKEIEAWLTTLQ